MVALLAGYTVQGTVTVYDPFARFGELLAEFVRNHPDPAAVQVHAEYPHPAELRVAGMWLAAAGAPAQLAVTSSPPPGGATFLLTNPPFGMQGEPAWLRRCVASLAEDGRAAVLMPYRAGFAGDARAYDIRRELIEQGAVLAVVALPAQMFPGSSIGVCIWLLRPPTGHATPVQLVDAHKGAQPAGTQEPGVHILDETDIARIAAMVAAPERRTQPSVPTTSAEIRGVLATPDEIRAHGYSLNPLEYQDRTLDRTSVAAAVAELDALFATSTEAARAELDAQLADLNPPSYTTGRDQGWPPRRLRDLCDISAGVPHKSLKPAISRGRSGREAVPVVHPRHLRNGLIDAGDAPNAEVASLERYRLRTHDVLCIRTGAMGPTAIVQHRESGWLPHTNLLRLRINKPAELDPTYLLTYLSQAHVQARIRDRSIRSITTSLSTDTLGDLEIPLPPLAEQRHILGVLQALDEQTATIERRLAATRVALTALGRRITDGTVFLTGREPR
jgi:type I restriction enzyme M protein